MDRQSTIVIVVCLVLIGLWSYVLVPKLYPSKPLPPGTSNSLAAPYPAAWTNTAAGTGTGAVATLEAPVRPAQLVANTNTPEVLLEVTNSDVHFTFTSYGGGVKLVELLHYPESVASRRERMAVSRVATLDTFTPVPTLAVAGDGVQDDGIFELSTMPDGVRATKTLTNGLRLVKEFELSSNYLLFATVRLENTGTQTVTLPAQEWVVGTATPMNSHDDGSLLGVMWYNGAKVQDIMGASYFSTRGFACTPRIPPADYRGGSNDVQWTAVHNQFFALAVMPQQPASQLVMRKVELPRPSPEEAQADSRVVKEPAGYEATLVYPAFTLPAHGSLQRQFAVFAGPKEYRTLATISATLNKNVDAVMGFGTSGFSAFFGFFSKGLLLWMNWLHRALGLSYGWTIIAITVIIKVVFWPLTQASTRSAKRMQALQPQIKALQEKYKDDPAKAQRKMMEFWKEHKINPMSGCLPTLIQMPVFIGFFYMIKSAIELRGASWAWVGDLSRPDTLFLIPGLNFPFNLLPLIMGGTMLWQAHLTPPSPGMDPTQAKMMRYMPLMFLVFLYSFSAGLTLYWTVNNLLSVVQTKLTRTLPQPAVTPGKGPALTSPPKKGK